ncbi:unnamed protein product [Amoebophrya sp. A120]|nr:unnamed protein product [Amoebophrya sp. A120]|eukprot:GSA120T00003531001.1
MENGFRDQIDTTLSEEVARRASISALSVASQNQGCIETTTDCFKTSNHTYDHHVQNRNSIRSSTFTGDHFAGFTDYLQSVEQINHKQEQAYAYRDHEQEDQVAEEVEEPNRSSSASFSSLIFETIFGTATSAEPNKVHRSTGPETTSPFTRRTQSLFVRQSFQEEHHDVLNKERQNSLNFFSSSTEKISITPAVLTSRESSLNKNATPGSAGERQKGKNSRNLDALDEASTVVLTGTTAGTSSEINTTTSTALDCESGFFHSSPAALSGFSSPHSVADDETSRRNRGTSLPAFDTHVADTLLSRRRSSVNSITAARSRAATATPTSSTLQKRDCVVVEDVGTGSEVSPNTLVQLETRAAVCRSAQEGDCCNFAESVVSAAAGEAGEIKNPTCVSGVQNDVTEVLVEHRPQEPEEQKTTEKQKKMTDLVPQEEVTEVPNWQPSLHLPVKEASKKVVSPASSEPELIFLARCKLYRFTLEPDEHWTDVGNGEGKLLYDRAQNSVSFCLHQDKTGRILLQTPVRSELAISENEGNPKTAVFNAFVEDGSVERVCLKFKNEETAKQFREKLKFKNEETAKQFREKFAEWKAVPENPEAAPPAPAAGNYKNGAATTSQAASQQQEQEQQLQQQNIRRSSTGPSSSRVVLDVNQNDSTYLAPKVLFGGDESDKETTTGRAAQGGEEKNGSKNPLIATPLFGSRAAREHQDHDVVEDNRSEFVKNAERTACLEKTKEIEQVEQTDEVWDVPNWQAKTTLEVKEQTTSGQEAEVEIFSHRCKLFRYQAADGDWKERGLGECFLLAKKVLSNDSFLGEQVDYETRFLMRQEKTGKLKANHAVNDAVPEFCNVEYQSGSKKVLQWSAMDCSEDEPEYQIFGAKFGTEATAEKFSHVFKACRKGIQSEEEMQRLLADYGGGNKTTAAGAGGTMSNSNSTGNGTNSSSENVSPVEEFAPDENKNVTTEVEQNNSTEVDAKIDPATEILTNELQEDPAEVVVPKFAVNGADDEQVEPKNACGSSDVETSSTTEQNRQNLLNAETEINLKSCTVQEPSREHQGENSEIVPTCSTTTGEDLPQHLQDPHEAEARAAGALFSSGLVQQQENSIFKISGEMLASARTPAADTTDIGASSSGDSSTTNATSTADKGLDHSNHPITLQEPTHDDTALYKTPDEQIVGYDETTDLQSNDLNQQEDLQNGCTVDNSNKPRVPLFSDYNSCTPATEHVVTSDCTETSEIEPASCVGSSSIQLQQEPFGSFLNNQQNTPASWSDAASTVDTAPTSKEVPGTQVSIFGTTSANTSSLFGSGINPFATTTETTTTSDSKNTSAAPPPEITTTTTSQNAPATFGMFGAVPPASNGGGGLFGGSSGGGLFGGGSSSGGSGLFGGGSTSTASTAPPAAPPAANGAVPENSIFTNAAARDQFIANAQATASAERTKQIETVETEEVEHISGWGGPKITLQVKEQPSQQVQWLYKQRAKLFRFKDNEWKERAIGELKIRFDDDVNEFIVSINQDKTGKIKACFPIQKTDGVCELKYQDPNSKKTVMFICSDSSDEDEQGAQRFALKFGSEEKCSGFMKVFTSLREHRKVPDDHKLPDGGAAEGPASAPAGAAAANGSSPKQPPAAAGASPAAASPKKQPAATTPLSPEKKSAGPAPVTNLFGGASSASAPAPPSGGLFGAAPPAPGGSLFGGGSSASETKPATNLFGGAATGSSEATTSTTGGSLFGGGAATGAGALSFGKLADNSAGLFGGGSSQPVATGGGLFGTAPPAAPNKPLEQSSTSATSVISSPKSKPAPAPAGALPEGTIFKSSAERENFIKNAQATATAERAKNIEVVEDQEVWDDRWGDAKVTLQVKNMQSRPENEVEIYKHRAKLFRFREGEWKERALGEAQLLRSVAETDDGGHESRVRFILRQDKTGKIQANFYLPKEGTDYCNLSYNQGSEKTWCFTAYDCSDDDPAAVKLALKFRDNEVAGNFRDVWENARKTMVGPVSAAEAAEILAQKSDEGVSATAASPNAAARKDSETVEKKPSPKTSPVVEASKPPTNLFGGAAASASSTGAANSIFGTAAVPSGGGLFGAKPPGGSLFGNSEPAAPAATGSLFGGGVTASPAAGGGLFGGGLFGGNKTESPSPKPFDSKTAEKKTIAFGATPPLSPDKKPAAEKTEEEKEREEAEREVWEGNYDVKVHLEAKSVASGFEGEEKLYESTAKVYRFSDGQMKDRGTGESFLLRDEKTNQTRFVLRQKQTGKIRMNFILTKEGGLCALSRTPNKTTTDFEPNVWYLTVFDCSEDAPSTERIAIKHKTAEMSEEFAQAFNAALEKEGTKSTTASSGEKKDALSLLPGVYMNPSDQVVGHIDDQLNLTYAGFDAMDYMLKEVVRDKTYMLVDEEGEQWSFNCDLAAGTLRWSDGDFWIKDVSKEPSPVTAPPAPTTTSPPVDAQQAPKQFSIATPPLALNQLKPQDKDKWSCDTCMLKWDQNVNQCGACESYKPGVDVAAIQKEQEAKKKETLAKLGVSSGGDQGSSSGSALGAAAASASVFAFGAGTSSATAAAPITFGAPVSGSNATPLGTGSLFGGFGQTAAPAAPATTSVFAPAAREEQSPAAHHKLPLTSSPAVPPSPAVNAASSTEVRQLSQRVREAADSQAAFRMTVNQEIDGLRRQVEDALAMAQDASARAPTMDHTSSSALAEQQARDAVRKIEALTTRLQKAEEGNNKQFSYLAEKIDNLATQHETAAVEVDSRMVELERSLNNQTTDKIQSLRTKLTAEMNAVKTSARSPAVMSTSSQMESSRVYELLNEQQETILESVNRQRDETEGAFQAELTEMQKNFERMLADARDQIRSETDTKIDKMRTQQAYNPASAHSSFSSRLSNLRAQRGISVGTPETVTVFGTRRAETNASNKSGVFTPTQMTPSREQHNSRA